MRGRLLAIAALAVTSLLATSATAQRAALAGAPVDYPLELVSAGLTGHALTAGAGNVIESFEVEVLGLLQDAGTGFPLVLVRAGGPFIERVGGVAAGMSGSPVYLELDGEDALLGAIGYVFPDADHSVALVTPIGVMRDERFASGPASAAPYVAGLGRAQPVATPVLLSGANARAAQLLAPLFAGGPVSPFPTQVASGSQGSAPYSLEPGAAVAVRLMSGDLDLSAVGTITTLEPAGVEGPPAPTPAEGADVPDHRFLAFGHPLLGTGAASYALSSAHVLEIVASSSVPFKLANTGSELLGAVDLDTPSALHGAIGSQAHTLPLNLTVVSGSGEERFAVDLAAAEHLYPTLTAVAALQASDRALRAVGPGHAALAWQIELAGGERVNLLEQTSSDGDIAFAAAVLAAGPLLMLADNAFSAPEVVSVDLSIEFRRDRNAATIESLVLEEEPVTAGDNAILHVRLQPFRKEAVVRTFSVPLPDDAEGEMTLLVRGGDVPRDIEGVPEEGGETAAPRSFPELLDAMRQQLQGSDLVVEAVDEYGEVERLLRVTLPFVVLGSEELTLEIAPAPRSGEAMEGHDNGSSP